MMEQIALFVAIAANLVSSVAGYIKLREDVATLRNDIDWIKRELTHTHKQ